MPSSEGGFRPKSGKELKSQLAETQTTLGKKPESSLVPPSVKHKDILKMPAEEIKNKYARRYEMYLQLLRHQKHLEKHGEPALSEKNLQEMKKWIVALNSLDDYIKKHKEGEESTLRERQLTVFEDLRNFLEAGDKEGYVKLPTGVGKTVLFTELIEALDLKTIIVVPTTLLITQTTEKIGQFAEGLDVGTVYSGAKEYGRQVTITTYDSFVSQVETGKINPADYDCLILDEAHVSLSEKRVETVQKFDKGIKIGFTATPEFSKTKKVGDLLETEIHRMSIREAVEENLLCSVSAVIAKTEVDISKVKINKQGDFDDETLEKAINIAGRNKAAVDLYKQNFSGELTVAYCVGIKHAQAASLKFNQAGVPSAHISGQMSPKVQESILKRFKSGEIKVLCNADLLIAGFDEQKASVCFNLRPTKSRVVAEQRGGRVLRLNPNNEEKHAYVVDFLDKGIDPGFKPVLFASILEGAHIKSKSRRTGKTGKGAEESEGPIIDVSGLKIITDVEEVMRVVRDIKEAGEKKESKFLSFEDLQIKVLAAAVKTREEYGLQHKMHAGWPSSPPYQYKSKWPGWSKFLGREVKELLSFYELQQEVRDAGIRGVMDYVKRYKEHTGWPSEPSQIYKDQWLGWGNFCRGETKKEPLALEDLTAEVKRSGITSSAHYFGKYKEYAGWPAQPHRFYNNWPGWEKFLGKENKFLSLAQLQKEVRAVRMIKTLEDYKSVYKEHYGWPAVPHRFYKDHWPGWEDFLGKEKKFISYEECQKQVRKMGIKLQAEYFTNYKEHPGWPARPDHTYKDKWPGWPQFLGKK